MTDAQTTLIHAAELLDQARGQQLCAGSGKVDRGNGTTKPCDCVAGLIERMRRRTARRGEL
jgi:hypothetical protein